MDKELLRIVIIALGLIIIVGMLLWGYFRSQRIHEDTMETRNYFHELVEAIKFRLASKADLIKGDEDVYANDIGGFESEQDSQFHAHTGVHGGASPLKESAHHQEAPVPQLPRLIQLSIVSKTEQGFNGAQLDAVFNMVGLEYGSMMVYERLDMNRMVDFAVASMINPGTFPDSHLETFHTPGITFFMQPQELPDASLVFSDLIRTIDILASELEGNVLDAERKPLSEKTLRALRKSLHVS